MLIVENDPAKVEADLAGGPCGLPGVRGRAGAVVVRPATFCTRIRRPRRGAPAAGALPAVREDPGLAA